jgi:uncharacterized repeat protein (TIGR01451 family)
MTTSNRLRLTETNPLLMRTLMILLFWTTVLAGTKVFAADAQAVDVRLQAFQVVTQDKGGEKLVPATEANPGDTIEYQVTYQNNGKSAAKAVAATLPVPEGAMVYLDGSAAPKAVQASLDGKQFSPLPLTREVMRNGRRTVEPVPPEQYRFLRWDLGDLAPGKAATVTSRMRVAVPPSARLARS